MKLIVVVFPMGAVDILSPVVPFTDRWICRGRINRCGLRPPPSVSQEQTVATLGQRLVARPIELVVTDIKELASLFAKKKIVFTQAQTMQIHPKSILN